MESSVQPGLHEVQAQKKEKNNKNLNMNIHKGWTF